jgi:signal transduction histidine kinase
MTAPRPVGKRPASSPASPWPLSRIIGGAVVLMTVFLLAAVVTGVLALAHLNQERHRIETTIDPAALAAQQLYSALLNQETGVRGYALSAKPDFLAPYTQGHAAEMTAAGQLRLLLPKLSAASAADLTAALKQAHDWRIRYAEPTIAQIKAQGKPVVSPDILAGRAEFDSLRAKLAVFEADVSSGRRQALSSLNRASDELDVALLVIAVGLAVVVAVLAVVLRATAIRPVYVVAAEARRVADGDFGHEVAPTGPREIRGLAADVNSMRERILLELSAVQEANEALADHAAELRRSNAELEQFAYIASHDLQEPLRKVTSFCGLLQRRYGGQLDEKADQYIDFAVDGAKRMQVLINDLLAFGRVGRSVQDLGPVACDTALAGAQANLSAQVEQTGAVIEAGSLPVVRAQLTLMTMVFQNLLGNALKFRGDEPPRIVVTAERDGAFWLFSVTDNGIGIEPQYADRIFLIFQRLHDRAAYPGTGIGLAMCRKIVDYFGGRIWLDTSVADGARFCFTLPALSDDKLSDDKLSVSKLSVNKLSVNKGTDALPECSSAGRRAPGGGRRGGRPDDQGGLRVPQDAQPAARGDRRGAGPGVRAPHRRVRRRPATGTDPARRQPPARQRPGGARRAQAGPGAQRYPRGHADHLAGRRGHPAQLPAACERLREQAGGLRSLHRRDPAD